jgi:hypothetical protein
MLSLKSFKVDCETLFPLRADTGVSRGSDMYTTDNIGRSHSRFFLVIDDF